jgi:hypothetical protein
MSLTPVEVAMCLDALLSAGVPQRIADEFIDLRGFRERVQNVRVDAMIDAAAIEMDRGIIKYTEARMARDLGPHLVSEGLATINLEETPFTVYLQHRVRLTLSVLAPHGWSKVQR